MEITDIEPVDGKTFKETEWSYSFWENPTAEDYARRQGVQSVADAAELERAEEGGIGPVPEELHGTALRRRVAWKLAELVCKTCRGRPMSLQDSWIAATALRHGVPLVSHNAKHFESIPGLNLITEAELS